MKGPLSAPRRSFAPYRNHPDVSVLIIGAGINGAGLLRELALQGVDALLVDRSDFGGGTTAASTRVIQGGLRDLENGAFRLVKESVRERDRLLWNAPHYVRPLRATVPIFDWTSGVWAAFRNSRGAFLVKAGLMLYDRLSGLNSPLPKHRFHSRSATLSARPALNPGLILTATYYDAQITSPERLCLELALDAENICEQARALNYVSVRSCSADTLTMHDEITGETCEIRPRVVVNASGPWIDLTNRDLGRESRWIGGTRGSHVVLDNSELFAAMAGDMIHFVNSDGRICTLCPFFGKVIAGTTDIPTRNPDAVCSEEEVTYILDATRQAFPSIRLERSDVVFRFCSVRPLPESSALTPGQMSRDHSYPFLAPGETVRFPVYSLVGGKLSVFRAFAEQVASEILNVLGRKRLRSSVHLAIGGGKGYPMTRAARFAWLAREQARTGLSRARLDALLDRYGSRALQIADYITLDEDEQLRHQPEYSRREIEFLASSERVFHLDDLVLRRTLLGILGQTTRPLLQELAEVVSPVLRWPRRAAMEDVERCLRILQEVHGVTPERLEL